jgi:hypothetical protein
MSNPDEVQAPAGEVRSAQQPVDQPMDVAAAIAELRNLVCGLGVALLVVSLVLSAFIWKQNRNLAAAAHGRQQQILQLRASQQQILPVLNELARYSAGKPELAALFAKHRMQITPPPASGEPVPAPSTRAP